MILAGAAVVATWLAGVGAVDLEVAGSLAAAEAPGEGGACATMSTTSTTSTAMDGDATSSRTSQASNPASTSDGEDANSSKSKSSKSKSKSSKSPPSEPRAGGRAGDGAQAIVLRIAPVAYQAATGVSSARRWQVGLQGGFPWWGARAQLGLGHGFSPSLDLQIARFRRFRPAVGIAHTWVDHGRLRISGEVLLGWLFQIGDLARRGPNVELRVRVALALRRASPYLMLGSQSTLLADRTTIDGIAGTSRAWSLRGEWTGWATLGVMVAATYDVALDFGLDAAWVDAASGAPAIPGAHFGVHFGGPR
ncbi:MAG: hypothetical protein R3B09_13450 [Nannocystaceae bacterium]